MSCCTRKRPSRTASAARPHAGRGSFAIETGRVILLGLQRGDVDHGGTLSVSALGWGQAAEPVDQAQPRVAGRSMEDLT